MQRKYWKANEDFKEPASLYLLTLNYSVGLCQLIIKTAIQVICCFVILNTQSSLDIWINYAAFWAISQVD